MSAKKRKKESENYLGFETIYALYHVHNDC